MVARDLIAVLSMLPLDTPIVVREYGNTTHDTVIGGKVVFGGPGELTLILEYSG